MYPGGTISLRRRSITSVSDFPASFQEKIFHKVSSLTAGFETLAIKVKVLSEVLEEDTDFMRANTVHQISELKVVLIDIIRGVYWYHRTVATHVLVVMISPESRSSKPYALPVQCIPYASLKDREVRDILNDVIREMVKLGMKVAGILIVFQLYYK